MIGWISQNSIFRLSVLGFCACCGLQVAPLPLRAEVNTSAEAFQPVPKDQIGIEGFLYATGFDVALDSIAHSAENAPAMIGIDARSFGQSWETLAGEVFDSAGIRDMAVRMLRETLSLEALEHAESFYASDLGGKLVRAENASHDIEDGDVMLEAGSRIIAKMVQERDPKIEVFRRMTQAVSNSEDTLRAVQTVQLRFLTAASDAGIINLQMDPETLAEAMREQEPFLRISISEGALASSAYTYQGFSFEELNDYVEALEHPLMQEAYSLLNSIQYEIQANRYEALAHRLTELTPNADL